MPRLVLVLVLVLVLAVAVAMAQAHVGAREAEETNTLPAFLQCSGPPNALRKSPLP